MTPELEQKLYNKYPKLFKIRGDKSAYPLSLFGIECGDGWFDILDRMCARIYWHVKSEREQKTRALIFNRALKKAINGDVKSLAKYFRKAYISEEQISKRIDEELKKSETSRYWPVNETVHFPQFSQIKEKFGRLTIYGTNFDRYIDGAVDMACEMSYVICEQCGKPGKKRGNSWIYVSCDEHAKNGD